MEAVYMALEKVAVLLAAAGAVAALSSSLGATKVLV
jgi:hypothetical protein